MVAGKEVVKTTDTKWEPEKTAVVICDMWARHWCDSASRRVAEMEPRINAYMKALRARGVLIIHCPSSGIKHYEGTPMRKRAKAAPVVATLSGQRHFQDSATFRTAPLSGQRRSRAPREKEYRGGERRRWSIIGIFPFKVNR